MYMIVDYVGVVFVNLGYKFFIGGEMGSILDSYWLIEFVGRQGLKKQNVLVEELFVNFFIEEKYIGDKNVLVVVVEKVGIEGVWEFLDDLQVGLKEVLVEE